jgi:pyridoxal phosphate enzyme (YggS family)
VSLKYNLSLLEERINRACVRANRRREDITLIAVTKTHSVETIQKAYDLGVRDLGENRVQELLKKKDELPNDIRWHLIGHLQSNKAKYIAPFIHSVHSIDSIETAKELSKRAEQQSRMIDVLIEINVAGESTKEGIAPTDCKELLHKISEEGTSLIVRGLMTVAPYEEDPERVSPYFRELRKLRDEFGLKDLSMGMTNDYEVAIEEGTTMIRIGSALFGNRE